MQDFSDAPRFESCKSIQHYEPVQHTKQTVCAVWRMIEISVCAANWFLQWL